MIPEVLVKEHLNKIITGCEHDSYCEDASCFFMGEHTCRADIPEGEHHAAITLNHIGAAWEACCPVIKIDERRWYYAGNHKWKKNDTEELSTDKLVTKYFESIKNK